MSEIKYTSTRGSQEQVSASEAIIRGIAADGGLFVPTAWPEEISDLQALQELSYQELAFRIMKPFLADFSEEELRNCILMAYDEKFSTDLIAPLIHKAGVHFLELYHGPTLAFKDMALAILPHLLKTAARKLKNDREIVILTATSGDTGKAALEGFAGVPGTQIIVFFPEHGVSEIQKRQMITQRGDNTCVIGIEGNFDDAQSGVKAIFADQDLNSRLKKAGKMFSSANSINIGRLIPQVVYYFYAYAQLCRNEDIPCGEEVNFIVPTGNFGNILAGYYAQKMGLPIRKLICASNENKVLYDFFATGVYDKNRPFVTTISPSMDILISSNLERLLYTIANEDGPRTRSYMESLNQRGRYEVTAEMLKGMQLFYGNYASEAETLEILDLVWKSEKYLMDPHTAVAFAVYQKYLNDTYDNTTTVVVSTASPFKFPRDVMGGLNEKYAAIDEFELIKEMAALLGGEPPRPIQGLEAKPILHRTLCPKKGMKKAVIDRLGI